MNMPAPQSAFVIIPGNSSFSSINPALQLGIDSTSLGEFKTCPRKYYYSIVLGWQPNAESVHLLFGIWMHQAREGYDKAKQAGASHEDALDAVLDVALRATWNRELGRPWISDHKSKNRLSLIRTIVWYLDQFGKKDTLVTAILPNGKPAVELSFRFDSGFRSWSTGEPFIFCGHLDRIAIADFNEKTYIADLKTTASALDERYFSGFTPGNQFSMYMLAAKVAFGVDIEALIVDGIQVGTGFSRFHRQLVPRPPEVIEEWLSDAGQWLESMDKCATENHWPMNDKACGMYGGCPFQPICTRVPAAREKKLKIDYTRRVWDPLISRGDI